jgi:uncharacterized protein YjlB
MQPKSPIRERFTENGWTGLWTDIIYDYTHFHSNAHEALVSRKERNARFVAHKQRHPDVTDDSRITADVLHWCAG